MRGESERLGREKGREWGKGREGGRGGEGEEGGGEEGGRVGEGIVANFLKSTSGTP